MARRSDDLDALAERVSAARAETEARGETFYPGPSRVHLAMFPPKERWDDWVELDSKAWPRRVEKHYMLVPTSCFNCEAACGLLAYVDTETLQVRKFEGNPEHPGSRGRNCAKGPATITQVTDPDRILHPMKRAAGRGEGRWVACSWDEALDDIAARIRTAIVEDRKDEVVYHVGRPGELGFTSEVLQTWGVDGHNSHTNVCSAGARAGFTFWMGQDRPSPDHAEADVILLISSHLEAGHYFNPHAQRISEAKQRGAKLIVMDVRLSNTATHADHWISPYPGSEAAILLAIANHLISTKQYDRAYVERWFNWREFLAARFPHREQTFEVFEELLAAEYAEYTFAFAAAESGVDEGRLLAVAETVARAGSRLSTHTWRSASIANEGGWQVARCLLFLNALMGAVAVPGGTYPNGWNQVKPRTPVNPDPVAVWNELHLPLEYPFAMYEMSFLLPQFMAEGRGTIDTYFSRVYNPVWTNPDGFSWVEALLDESKFGLHVAMTPTWNETAYLADYVLPMGHSSERHDMISYEQYDGQWIGFRQPVLREARQRLGETITDTREVNPGEVWEENEFWIELSWRIDPDGSLGIRKHWEAPDRPGERMTVDDYYGWVFEHGVPGLKERAAEEGLTGLEFMRRYGGFEVRKGVGPINEEVVGDDELDDVAEDDFGRVYTRGPKQSVSYSAGGSPEGDGQGRRPAGVRMPDGSVRRGFPTPSGRLEFYSSTLDQWGWGEYALPTYIRSHIHPEQLADGEVPLVSTFRLPVQIHTRSANAKWLNELAHTNPLWIHPSHARELDVATGDLVRVTTHGGHFVVKAWVTEGIRPGVVACSHHMGRWKPSHETEGRAEPAPKMQVATVDLVRDGQRWSLENRQPSGAFRSGDADMARIWWTDIGVHQNATFPVHPDPISGAHCWHQAVRVTKAEPGDGHGDVVADTGRMFQVYRDWLAKTRDVRELSPNGERRPHWIKRPLKPVRECYAIPALDGGVAGAGGAAAAGEPDGPS